MNILLLLFYYFLNFNSLSFFFFVKIINFFIKFTFWCANWQSWINCIWRWILYWRHHFIFNYFRGLQNFLFRFKNRCNLSGHFFIWQNYVSWGIVTLITLIFGLRSLYVIAKGWSSIRSSSSAYFSTNSVFISLILM